MKTKILYLSAFAFFTYSIAVTGCSSSKKADTLRRDSINQSNTADEPDTAKVEIIKKDTV